MIDNSTIQMVDTSTFQWGTIIPAIAALGSLLAASFSFFSIRANINTTKSGVLLDCLKEYRDIRKDRTKALTENRQNLCFDYYRELFDLHWTEFRLWTMGYIDNAIMESWLNARYRNSNDILTIKDETGKEIRITYKETWNKLLEENYFEINDPFIRFMNYAHNGEFEEALDLKRRLKKNENLFSRITLFLSRKRI